jgi:hypothetical protein
MLPLLETLSELLLWNIFQCRRRSFFGGEGSVNILKSSSLLGRLHFWKQPEVIRNQIKGIGRVFHFSNRFLSQKLRDTERLVSWSIVIVGNPIAGPKFRPFPTHSFK